MRLFYSIQSKVKGQSWVNLDYPSSFDRMPVALEVQKLAKANIGTAYKVLTSKTN